MLLSPTPESLHALARHEPDDAQVDHDWAREPGRVRLFRPGTRRIPRTHVSDPIIRAVVDACRAALGPTGRSGTVALRGAPSAGARYPIEVSLLSSDGLARYCPITDLITPVRGTISGTGLTIGLSAVAGRTAWRYGPLSYRQLLWDAGAALATLMARCCASSLTVRTRAVLSAREAAWALPSGEIPLAALDVGDHVYNRTGIDDQEARRAPGSSPRQRSAQLAANGSVRAELSEVPEPADVDDIMFWHHATSDHGSSSGRVPSPARPLLLVPPFEQARTFASAIDRRRSAAESSSADPLPRHAWDSLAKMSDAAVAFDVDGVATGVHIDGTLHQKGSFRGAVDALCLTRGIAGGAAALAVLCLPPEAFADGSSYRIHQLRIGAQVALLQLSMTAARHTATPLTLFERLAQEALDTVGEPQLALAIR